MHNETQNKNSPAADSSIYPVDADGDKMILFSGKIVRKNGALAFSGPLVQFFLTVAMGKAAWLQKIDEQEEMCIGVMAKRIRIDDGSAKDVVRFVGIVEKKSFDGLNNYVNAVIGGDRIIVKAGNAIGFNDGDDIRLNFSRNDASLFRCSSDNIINQKASHLALSVV